eukprot:CFRG2755T1
MTNAEGELDVDHRSQCESLNTVLESLKMSPSKPCTGNMHVVKKDVVEFVILGSGVSTALPKISCVLRPNGNSCRVCHDGIANPSSKNVRGNVCALVRSKGHSVLIDCGKTIRDACIRHFPKLGVETVDAIVLTHGHADAILGLDDARDIQIGSKSKVVNGIATLTTPKPTPVYLNEECMKVCEGIFSYLMPNMEAEKKKRKQLRAEKKNHMEREHNICAQRQNYPQYSQSCSCSLHGDAQCTAATKSEVAVQTENNEQKHSKTIVSLHADGKHTVNSTDNTIDEHTSCNEKEKKIHKDRAKPDIVRRVAALSWKVYDEDRYFLPFKPIQDADIEFTPIPVLHGGDFVCMAFVIKIGRDTTSAPPPSSTCAQSGLPAGVVKADDRAIIAYLSDVHMVPTETLSFLKALPRIDLLVVDALGRTPYASHFSLGQAQGLVRELRPVQSVCVGMTCQMGMHNEIDFELKAMRETEGLDFRSGWDGQRFPF